MDYVENIATYKTYHLNKINLAIHFLCVPVIMWSLFVLLAQKSWAIGPLEMDVELILFYSVFPYWFFLEFKVALGMLVFVGPMHLHVRQFKDTPNAFLFALAVFIIGWIGQAIGHYKYENAKPAFFDDLRQLLIGPFFLMTELYFLFGWNPELQEKIDQMAIKRRRKAEDAKQQKLKQN